MTKRTLKKKVGTLLAATVLTLLLAEGALRLFLPQPGALQLSYLMHDDQIMSRVARIDGAAGAVASVAHVADKGSHLALDPDGKWLYLADFAAGELVVMDAHSLDVAGRFAAPGGPQLPLAAGGGIACVTGPGSGMRATR